MNVIAKIEAYAKRLEKAKALAAEGKVYQLVGDKGGFAVEGSQGRVYYVNGSCGCEDYRRHAEKHGEWWCKHKLAVEIVKTEAKGDPDAQAQRTRRATVRAG